MRPAPHHSGYLGIKNSTSSLSHPAAGDYTQIPQEITQSAAGLRTVQRGEESREGEIKRHIQDDSRLEEEEEVEPQRQPLPLLPSPSPFEEVHLRATAVCDALP